MSQPRDPPNDFIEFVQVWGGRFDEYLEGVVMYDSRNGSKYTLRYIYKDFARVYNKHCLKREQLQGSRFKWGSRFPKE